MNVDMFAQIALSSKLDLDRRLQLDRVFYDLPELKKREYIETVILLAHKDTDLVGRFLEFSRDVFTVRLSDSAEETHKVLLDAVIELSVKSEVPDLLSKAADVFWIWRLPDSLRDQAFTAIFLPCLGHRDQSVRRIALIRISAIVRKGAISNSPSEILRIVDQIWQDDSLPIELQTAALSALRGLVYYDEEVDYGVSKLVCAGLRSDISEFRHEATVVIATSTFWKIAPRLRKDAFNSLLRILKEERDHSFILEAFKAVPGEIPEWAQNILDRIEEKRNRGNELLSRESKSRKPSTKNYDFAISFAGEDRQIAQDLATRLVLRGVTVFYDDFERTDLWGKNLFQHLQMIYRDIAEYALVLISANYEKKPWAAYELAQANERASKEESEYILPVRLDATDVSGIARGIVHLDARLLTLDQVADFAVEKLRSKRTQR